MEQRSSQAGQAAAAKQETVRRIGDYAKQIVLEMEQKGQIAKLPQQELSRSPHLEVANICPEGEGPSHVVKEGSEQVIKDEQLHQGSVPPTQRAPFIPRANLCITANIADDLEYRGRSTIHHVFTDAPEKTLMFAHEYDTSNRNEEEGVQEYFVQKYPVLQRSTGRFGAGRSRHDVIEDAIRRAEYEVKRANDEKKEIITFRDIAENRAQVGSYPLPKHYNRVREPTSRSGGYFVVDKKCKEWLDHYGKLREQYATKMNPFHRKDDEYD
nr:unnamed protein product [Haemonchus contortus]